MAFRTILLALVYSSCNILFSEGSSVNQTNSTQNSTLVISSTPQTVSLTTGSSQVSLSVTPSISQSSSSLASSKINSSLATTPTIQPSSTSVQASSSVSGDTFQLSAGQGGSSGGQASYVVLPPETERRDFSLMANTKLRWVRYLLDKTGPEFSVLKQFVENHLNKIYKDVAGYIKAEVMEFMEEKVTFQAILYTKKSEKVSKNQLEGPMNKAMSSEKTNELKTYAFEISPRFTEMPNDGNLEPPFSPPEGEKVETVDGIMNFLQGFGAMFALILVFASIGFLKYKACNSKKNQDSDQTACLQEVHDNEASY